MGKYSLENYEVYKTIKIRPVPLGKAPDNYGRGTINYIVYVWPQLEPLRGKYSLDTLMEELSHTINSVLIIKPDKPEWLHEYREEYFAKLIRKVGSCIGKKSFQMVGIVITTMNDSKIQWNAYMEAFDTIPILADLHQERLINYLQSQKREFGLLVNCCENNWLYCCEAFARNNLQNMWERQPIIINVTDADCGASVRREALRWHAGFSNLSLDLGFNFSLRRLTYPKEVCSNGYLPIRFWFVNTGSAPCYQKFNLMLRLEKDGIIHIIKLNVNSEDWLLGDLIHNEIIPLPLLYKSEYTLSIGIFYEDNFPMLLNLQSDMTDGFYEMGTIFVNNEDKDTFKNIWDSYYPEGYYPLENPKAPVADE